MDTSNYKKCGKCQKVFSIDNFFSNASRSKGLSSSCKKCHLEEGQTRYFKQRQELLNAYGGKCTECGITDMRVLCIDHINGGGMKEMLSFENLKRYFKSLMPANFTKYQVLCQNHNWKKRHTNQELHKKGPKVEPVDSSYEGPTKRCPTCKFTYSTDNFYSKPYRSDGLASHCKVCFNLDTAKRKRTLGKFLSQLPYPPECEICKESDVQMLHVDHREGKGNWERKEFASGDAFIKYLETLSAADFNTKYSVLCANHNTIKVWENRERYHLEHPDAIEGEIADYVIANTKEGRQLGSKFIDGYSKKEKQ